MKWLKELFQLPHEHVLIGFSISFAAAFLLGGYEFIRSSSGSLFKAAYGADAMPYMLAVLPFAIFFALWVYGRILTWFGPRRTLLITSVGSALLIFAGFFAIETGSKFATAAIYVLREVYVVLVLEQYWSLINSRISPDSAKKLNGPICGFASLGPIACGMLISKIAVPLGAVNMLLGAGLLTLFAALFANLAYRYVDNQKLDTVAHQEKHGSLALDLFRKEKVLFYLFILIICTQMVSTFLTLRFESVTQLSMPDPNQQTAYMGFFYSMLNLSALLLQFVAAPILLRFVPVRWIHLGIPLLQVAAVIWLIQNPSLLSATAFAYFLFKSLDYSIFRAAKEIFYIPLSFDARYRAKEVIDVFAYRSGKGGTSLAIVLSEQVGLVLRAFYGWLTLGVLVAWLGVVWKLTHKTDKE